MSAPSAPIRGVASGGDRGCQLVLPLGDLLDHGVDGRVGVLQRQQQAGEAPQRARGGDGLGERLLTEPGVRSPSAIPGFPF